MIVIVDNTAWVGLVVRWSLTDRPEACSELIQPDLSASREGVMVGAFLHRVEGPLLDDAKRLHLALAEGDPGELQRIRSAVPTHVRVRGGGAPVPVGAGRVPDASGSPSP